MPRLLPHSSPGLAAEFDNVYAEIDGLRLAAEDVETGREVETRKVVSFGYPIELNHTASGVWKTYEFGLASPHGPAYTLVDAGMAWLSQSVPGLDFSTFQAGLKHRNASGDYWAGDPPNDLVFALFGYTQALGKVVSDFRMMGKPINAPEGDEIFLEVWVSSPVDLKWRAFCFGTYIQHDGVGLDDVS